MFCEEPTGTILTAGLAFKPDQFAYEDIVAITKVSCLILMVSFAILNSVVLNLAVFYKFLKIRLHEIICFSL